MATFLAYVLYTVAALMFVFGAVRLLGIAPGDSLLPLVLAFAALWAGEAIVQLARIASESEKTTKTLASWQRRQKGRDG